MKITSQTEETLVRKTTTIDREDGSGVVVLDYVNDSGKIVDSVYRDAATGNEIDDPTVIDEIDDFMVMQKSS